VAQSFLASETIFKGNFSRRSSKKALAHNIIYGIDRAIGDTYSGLDLNVETFPDDNVTDPNAFIAALDSFKAGDAVTIFTPVMTYDIMSSFSI
jgi:hypothetical protein